jgi:hypothetical protein
MTLVFSLNQLRIQAIFENHLLYLADKSETVAVASNGIDNKNPFTFLIHITPGLDP